MATATGSATTQARVGKVVQVIGPVVDIEFEAGNLPAIYNAVTIRTTGVGGETVDVVCEVEQHLGENRVRTVAMKPTDGMRRGMEVVDALMASPTRMGTDGDMSAPTTPIVMKKVAIKK